MATGNAINADSTGLVKYDGAGTFSGVTVTQHDVLVGAASNGITSVGPGSSGQVLQSGGGSADPAYSTATYPATTTINQILYSSSANVVGGITAANNGTMISGTTGIPSWLANGTTGQVLTATTGSPPSWAAASSGSLVLIQSQTASSSASISFTTGITSTYTTYFFTLSNVVSSSADILLQLSTNGGSSYLATGYTSGLNYFTYNNAAWTNVNGTTAFHIITGSATNNGAASFYLYNITSTLPAIMLGHAFGNSAIQTIGGGQSGTTAVNAFQFTASGGNITSGKFTLYGVLE